MTDINTIGLAEKKKSAAQNPILTPPASLSTMPTAAAQASGNVEMIGGIEQRGNQLFQPCRKQEIHNAKISTWPER